MQIPRFPSALLLLLSLTPLDTLDAQTSPDSIQARSKAARQAALAKISGIVRGRCIDAVTGKPLAGCSVSVWASRRPKGAAAPRELTRPKAQQSDAAGRFAVRVVAREDYWVNLEVSVLGRVPRRATWQHLTAGEVEDVGDVRLREGVRLVGTIQNQRGRPIPDVKIEVRGLQLSLGDAETSGEKDKADKTKRGRSKRAVPPRRAIHASSDAKGRLESKEALPPGTYPIRVFGRGLNAITESVTIPAKGKMQPVTIRVEELPSISGFVVDRKGRPAVGVHLNAIWKDGGTNSARTDTKGHFRLYREKRAPDRVRLFISRGGPCEPADVPGTFAWGKTGVKITLQRALTVEVHVVDAGTQKPIESFSVRAYPREHSIDSRDRNLRHAGRHPKGIVRIENVRRGRTRIQVVPKDKTLLPETKDVPAKDGMAPVRIALRRLAPMKVLIVDEQGRPLKGVSVRVIALGNYVSESDDVPLDDPRRQNNPFSSDPDLRFDTQISVARTDGGGQCIVYGIAGRKDLVLGLGPNPVRLQRIENVTFGPDHLSRRVTREKSEARPKKL